MAISLRNGTSSKSGRARRRTSMVTDSQFNDEQLQAIHYSKEVVIVPAGPGSGKSHTLVGRILFDVEGRSIKPEFIVAMTFTNNAARVFSDRLAEHNIV